MAIEVSGVDKLKGQLWAGKSLVAWYKKGVGPMRFASGNRESERLG